MYFFALCLFAITSLHSLFSGSPNIPAVPAEGFITTNKSWMDGRAGYVRDMIFNTGMKSVDRLQGSFDKFSYLISEGSISLNFFHTFGVFANLGSIEFDIANRPVPGEEKEYFTKRNFTWGLGGRLIIFNYGKATLGLNGQYQAAEANFSTLATNGVPLDSTGNSMIKWNTWQIVASLSYNVDFFYPYISVKFSSSAGRFLHLPNGFLPGTDRFKAENSTKYGIITGVTFSTDRLFQFTIELRMIDEDSIAFASEIRF